MATITTSFGDAGRNLGEGCGTPTLATALRDVADDLAAIRTSITTLTAKIDADSTDTGGDSDYAATCDPAALLTVKG